MKILIVSDIHSDYVAAESAGIVEKPDLVLDCGDHEEFKNLFKYVPHFYIHGNHEPHFIDHNRESMPLPNKVHPGQIIVYKKGKNEIRFSGLDGNYSSSPKQDIICDYTIGLLRRIEEGELDILLTHESPLLALNMPSYSHLAEKVIDEVDRIKPRFVFSGHLGRYDDSLKTPGGVTNVILDDMKKGYCVLDAETFSLKRIQQRFG